METAAAPRARCGGWPYNAVWRPSTEGELQVHGWSDADFRARYDDLWEQGWRLKLLRSY